MAKNQQDNTFHSRDQKIDYFNRRVNDASLTEGQRKYAADRLNSLCGGKSNSVQQTQSNCSTSAFQQTKQKFSDAQKYAYGAGIGYSAAKSGKRVSVRDENKDSFRAGYNSCKSSK